MGWKTENSGARYRVVVTKDLPGERWRQILTQADCELHISTSSEILSTTEIQRAIGSRCDAAIGQLTESWAEPLFGALADAGGRAYSNYAVGYDNVDLSAATRRGIAVGNTPGVLTETTAEMAVALVFAAARRTGEAESYLRSGQFTGWLPDLFLGKRLSGGVLGIVGAGRIGAAVARMLAPGLSMDLLYWDIAPRPELESFFADYSRLQQSHGGRPLQCRRVDDVDELLQQSDVVSLHTPLNAQTRHLVSGERLALMKPDAVLVNTARGPVVDESALVNHLRKHPHFRAGLDVFEEEPSLAEGLVDLPNCVLVPHIASATTWTREGMATLAAANVAGVLQGQPLGQGEGIQDFFQGKDCPSRAPSILNAAALER